MTVMGSVVALLGIGEWIKDKASDLAGSAIGALASAVADALGDMLKALGTLWVNIPTPNLTDSANGMSPSAPVSYLQDSLHFYVAAIAIAGLLVAGARTAIEQNGDATKDAAKAILRVIAWGSFALVMLSWLSIVSDEFSVWILSRSTTETDFGKNITMLLTAGGGAPMVAFAIVVLGSIGFLTALIQLALMLARGGLLVIATGVAPMAAAASIFKNGQDTYNRLVGWVIAWLLYKPAAAIVYATSFQLAGTAGGGSSTDKIVSFTTGLVLMALAVLALPALIKFVTPAVGAVAGSSSGGGAMAAAAPAMGAIAASKMGGGWGGGGAATSAMGSGAGGGAGAGAMGATPIGGPAAVGLAAVGAGAQAAKGMADTATGSGEGAGHNGSSSGGPSGASGSAANGSGSGAGSGAAGAAAAGAAAAGQGTGGAGGAPTGAAGGARSNGVGGAASGATGGGTPGGGQAAGAGPSGAPRVPPGQRAPLNGARPDVRPDEGPSGPSGSQ